MDSAVLAVTHCSSLRCLSSESLLDVMMSDTKAVPLSDILSLTCVQRWGSDAIVCHVRETLQRQQSHSLQTKLYMVSINGEMALTLQ